MTLVQVHQVPLSSSGLVKMEERKRPASYDNDDSAPPLKRQATAAVNGASKIHDDTDMPNWGREELEVSLARSGAENISNPNPLLFAHSASLTHFCCTGVSERGNIPTDAILQTAGWHSRASA